MLFATATEGTDPTVATSIWLIASIVSCDPNAFRNSRNFCCWFAPPASVCCSAAVLSVASAPFLASPLLLLLLLLLLRLIRFAIEFFPACCDGRGPSPLVE